MRTYFKVLNTNEGEIHILTKTKWLYVFPMPHTSVMPRSSTNLKRLGTLIKWTTNNPEKLKSLHDAITRLVEQIGISGLVEVANSAKMSEQMWKGTGAKGNGLLELVKMAKQEGIDFPVPEDVLKYIKEFA